jgi:16S rRNA (guanine1207-N2)-methyltransferase
MSASDPALETLLLPFVSGQLQWRDDALFLRARYASSLSSVATGQLICEQSFKPDADELQRMGFSVSPALLENAASKKFSLILILPPRQRDEARVLFARAMHLCGDGGVVIAAAGNNEGARSLEADLEKLSGNIQTLSKNKCRVFWSASHEDAINRQLLTDWMQLDQSRPILNGRFISRPGVFAWDHIDTASALLAQHLPSDLTGKAADLGAGFGYLSDELLRKCTSITSLDVYEAEYRALQLSKLNLEQHQSRLSIQYCWHDVTGGLPHKYDVIITNPPFHAQGSMDRPDIGRRFISVAAQSLHPGGQLWLVANRHLPYEEVLAEGFDGVRMIAQQQGYKIIAAKRSSAVRHKRQ